MMWKVLALLAGPSLAAMYAIVASLFLPSFRECPWSTHVPSTVPRISLVAAVVAVIVLGDDDLPTMQTIVAIVVLTFLSAYLMVQTRIHVVQGGPHPPLGDMTDKVVVITGANTGIGKETARLLAQQGAIVVMACRSAGKAQHARIEIVQGDDRIDEGKIKVVSLDLSKLDSVRKAAVELRASFPKIHVLINNAGVMMSQRVATEDGYEMVMQANHLGHYLLTCLLLDHMADDGRILCLTSSTYSYAEKIDLDDLFCAKGRTFSLFGQYSQSKLANIMFVQELARRTKYFCAAVHPGLVRTDVVRNMPWYLRYPNQLFAAFLAALQKTPTQGAWCSAYLASVDIRRRDDNGENLLLPNGKYWVNQKVQDLWPCAQDLEGAKKLWSDSEQYVHFQDKK